MKRIADVMFILFFSFFFSLAFAAKPKPDNPKDDLPPSCTCKNLPAMVKEIIEQEFMQKLFFSWYDFTPVDINDIPTMQDRAAQMFQQQFYPKDNAGNAGTTHGAHAELGTKFRTPECTIGAYQYGADGKPVLDAEGNHAFTPLSEEEHMKANKKKGCEALVRYSYIHEQQHEKTCKELNAKNEQSRWDRLAFFAREDSRAYEAGVKYLREQTRALALNCGWQGSTGPNAVPTPKDAKKLANRGGKIVKSRSQTGKVTIVPYPNSIAILMGVRIDHAPLDELIGQWEQSCGTSPGAACDALVTSIEVGLYELIRMMTRNRETIERETLVDLAHAQLPLLKRHALMLLGSARSTEEIAIAMQAADHPSPAVRDAAERLMQGTDNTSWKAMQRWSKRESPSTDDNLTDGLVPDLSPQPSQFDLKTFDKMRFRYFASTQDRAVFTTKESDEVVIKRLSQGREVMKSLDAFQKNMDDILPKMQAMEKEMTAAAAAGDSKKLNELLLKLAEIQKQTMAVDVQAFNPTSDSTAIVLAKGREGLPSRTATIQRDDAWGETVVTLWREGGWR